MLIHMTCAYIHTNNTHTQNISLKNIKGTLVQNRAAMLNRQKLCRFLRHCNNLALMLWARDSEERTLLASAPCDRQGQAVFLVG